MPEPLQRVEFALSDYDRSQLPLEKRNLQGEAFRKAVQEQLESEYAVLGGFIEIVTTDKLVSIRWKQDAASSNLVEQGIGYLSAGDLPRGVAILRLAGKSDPQNSTILFNLGMALSDLGELVEAISCLEKATQLCPSDARAFTALGVAYVRSKKPVEAQRALETAVRLDPEDSYALRNLGGMLLTIPDQAGRSRELLKKATELAPNDPMAWMGLANAEEALGNMADADAAYLKVIQIKPYGPMADIAKSGRGRIAEQAFRSKGGPTVRMDAVMYCAGALQRFAGMNNKEIEKISTEIAILGMRGLDVNDPTPKYQVQSLKGKFSGLHFLCIEYVGFKLTHPEMDLGFDLTAEYAMAKKMPH